MEEKKDRLINAVRNNQNIAEELKGNIETLAELIVANFPDYDYSNLQSVLSSLKIEFSDEIDAYSLYDREDNKICINTDLLSRNGVDFQHWFLGEMLKASTKIATGYEGYQNAVTSEIISLINMDEGRGALDPEGRELISIFSGIVDPSIIIGAYINGSVVDVITYLDSVGVPKQDFDAFASSLNELHTSNTAFTTAETQLIEMYRKVISTKMVNGELDRNQASKTFAEFSTRLWYHRSKLISLYEHHDFSNLEGFDNVEVALLAATEELESKANELSGSGYSK